MGCLFSKKQEEVPTAIILPSTYVIPAYAYEGYGYELKPEEVRIWRNLTKSGAL